MYDPSMRVLTVLELLQARERVTGPELARRLEVSPRTVQRYVARLQDLGIPVEGTRGAGGAYRLKPGARVPPLMFSDDEALALSLGLRALRHLGLGDFAPATAGAGAKLERVLPPGVAERVRDVEDAVALDTDPWIVQTDAAPIMTLAHAVRARRRVQFGYESHAGEQTEREVEPYGVVHLDGRWYLVGRCCLRGALRSFRLDRVSHLEVQGATFVRPADFDARSYLHAALPFARAPHHIEVWLDLPPEQAWARLSPSRVVLAPFENGTLLRCTRENLEPFAAMLLGLGCRLTVHEPSALRDAFRALAGRALQAAQGGEEADASTAARP